MVVMWCYVVGRIGEVEGWGRGRRRRVELVFCSEGEVSATMGRWQKVPDS